MDGVNVRDPNYGNPLLQTVTRSVAMFRPFTILNLDSKEEKSGTSLANPSEARLAVYLFQQLKQFSRGISTKSRIAVITPYAQQSRLLKQEFAKDLGPEYEKFVEVNTVDAFQGREASIVIFSAVRASDRSGIGFLADVRRMNVALTRAKHFLFVIARVNSIAQNPYWKDLVDHARETNAVVHVPVTRTHRNLDFGMVSTWHHELPDPNAPPGSTGATMKPAAPVPLDPRRPPNAGLPRKGSVPKDPRRGAHGTVSIQAAQGIPEDPRQKPRDPRVAPSDPRPSGSSDGSNTSSDTSRPLDPRKRKKYT